MSGELETLPIRNVTHIVGHDASGLAGRSPTAEMLSTPTTGEIDIAVTSATSMVKIGPATGNITIDQITGLGMGQVVPLMFIQGASAFTFTLAGSSNAVEFATSTFVVKGGNGARTSFLLEGRWGAGDTIVPTLHLIDGPA